MAMLMGAIFAGPASAQSIIELYQEARLDAQLGQIEEAGGFYVPPMPCDEVPLPRRDAIMDLIDPPAARPAPGAEPFRLKRVRVIPKLNRQWFLKRHAGEAWVYSGHEDTFTTLDTTFTYRLRGLLQARHGAPTQTVVEHDYQSVFSDGELAQFEYWFEVNDTIPLVVMDVNGPFERGLVLATHASHADMLLPMRHAFLKDLRAAGGPAPYLDYYYHAEEKQWYLAGYDGRRFFAEPIRTPNLRRGRPWRSFLSNSGGNRP